MRVAVIANGDYDPEWGSNELKDFDLIIAADGGGNNALRSGIIPDVLIGDLDSIAPENLEKCRLEGSKIVKYPDEKDETDLELALEFAIDHINKNEASSESIYLYGALGGRVDHMLGNLALLQSFYKRGYRIKIRDPRHEIWLISGEESIKGQKGQQLSLIPMTEDTRVSTRGLYYPLNDEILEKDSPRGISNVFLGEDASIQVNKGIILAVLLNLSYSKG